MWSCSSNLLGLAVDSRMDMQSAQILQDAKLLNKYSTWNSKETTFFPRHYLHYHSNVDMCFWLFWSTVTQGMISWSLVHSLGHLYTGCPRRKGQNFGRVFLMLKYTDITQNTYIQSWMVTEIMAREVWNFDNCYTLIDYQIHIKTGRNMWFL